MQPTRRYWETIGIAAVLMGASVLFERPSLLIGAGGIAGWLLAMQLAFLVALDRFDATLSIDHDLTPAITAVEEPATLTLAIGDDTETAGMAVTATARPAAGLRIDGDETLTTQPGDRLVVAVESTIAGEHTIAPPRLDLTDASGLFRQRIHRGPERSLVVEPHTPSRTHIGEGGTAIATAVGEHASAAGEQGLVPAELREYVAGDAAARIDWNATARLTTPHVRTFDVESDVPTCFILDRRASLSVGPAGETAFDHLRASALTYAAVAESLGDPVSCLTIAHDRIEHRIEPAAASRHYDRLRQHLRSLTVDSQGDSSMRVPSLSHRSPTLDQTTHFGRTLSRYLVETTRLRSANPLSAAVRYAMADRDMTHLVLCTDDTDRAGIRDAIAEARQRDSRLLLFLAPRVLYETDTDADANADADANTNSKPRAPSDGERYREFERFRRSIAAIEHVTAYEVAPQTRIETVLNASANTIQ